MIVSITTIVYVVATVAELVVVLEAVLVDLSVVAVAVGIRKRGMGRWRSAGVRAVGAPSPP